MSARRDRQRGCGHDEIAAILTFWHETR